MKNLYILQIITKKREEIEYFDSKDKALEKGRKLSNDKNVVTVYSIKSFLEFINNIEIVSN